MTTPDERPRPQYGEYATPEEQQARIRQPDATLALDTGQTPGAVAPEIPARPVAGQPAQPPVGPPPGHAAAPAAPAASARATTRSPQSVTIDRLITFVLLGYGLFQVIGFISGVANFPVFAADMLTTLDGDASVIPAGFGIGWGIAAALVSGLGWLAAAVLSWRRLRSGRVTFWVPLTIGVIGITLSVILVWIPIVSDPAVFAAFADASMAFWGTF